MTITRGGEVSHGRACSRAGDARYRRSQETKDILDMSWQKIHNHYQKQDWVDMPSIFAQEAIIHFPKGSRILEI
jgi:hypothetical protein